MKKLFRVLGIITIIIFVYILVKYVVIGEINHTLRTMLRLKQRSGKKIISVVCDNSKPLRYADVVHSSLEQLDSSHRQLYIYNLNKISEQNIYKVLSLASIRDQGLGNVLESSDLPNYCGLRMLEPEFNTGTATDFLLAYGSMNSRPAGTGFMVQIDRFADADSPADLILPGSSYLETEGTALANNCGITRFRNPARSTAWTELLRLFYELDWISPATADSNHWLAASEELIQNSARPGKSKFDAQSVNEAALRDKPNPVDSALYKRIAQMYELRKTKTGF